MQKTTVRRVITTALLAATALSTAAVAAEGGFEEIIITAQKRSQSLQDAPLSVSAFSGEDLRTAGFQTLEDIANRVPSLQLQDNGMVARFSLRGINLNSISDASESPIQVVFDGVAIGSSSNFGASLFDLERIEVLRGPQGTLYGRNATGGLVNLITKRPTEEFEGYVSAQYGNFDKRVFEGAAGGSLTDGVRFRASVKSDTDSGLQTNVINGDKWWKSDTYAGRLQLAVDLSDSAEVLLRAHYSEMDGVGPGYGLFGNRDPQDPTLATICSIAATLDGDCVANTGEAGTNKATRIISANTPPPAQREDWGVSAEMNWHINDYLSLFSLTVYEELEKFRREDADGTAGRGNTIGSGNDYSQFSQEIRLHGTGDAFTWVAGAFYFWSEANVFSDFGFFPAPQGDLGGSTVKTESFAFFVDGTYALTDQINLSLGGRYTNEDKNHDGLNLAPLVFPFVSPDVAVPFSFDISDEVFTWRAVLDFQPSDDMMYYASVSTGYKAPGFNTQFLFSTDPFAAAPSDKEEVTTFEAGVKSAWLENSVIFNAAAYYSDYKGLQQVLTVPTPIGVNTPVLTNVDKAEIYGAEVDLSVRPNEYFDFIGAASYLHSEIKDPTSGFDGNVVSAAPEFSFSLTGRAHLPWGSDGRATFQASYRWQDKMYFSLGENPLQGVRSYGVLDLRVIAQPPGYENVTLEVFANNVTNTKYWVHVFGSGAIGGGSVAIWGQPRMYGVKARLDF